MGKEKAKMYTQHSVLMDRLVAVIGEAGERLTRPKCYVPLLDFLVEPARSSILAFSKAERAILARDFATICHELCILMGEAQSARYLVVDKYDGAGFRCVRAAAIAAANKGDDTYAFTAYSFVSSWYRRVVKAYLKRNAGHRLTELQLTHATSFFQMDGAEIVAKPNNAHEIWEA